MQFYNVLPMNIYNMDEKGFLLGKIQKGKRIVPVESLKSGRVTGSGQDSSREWISLLAAICMDGTYLPPALIYAAVSGNIQDTWVDDFDPVKQCAFFASSPNGWTSKDLGFHWLSRIFNMETKRKARNGRDYRLLIVDGHNSHVNMRFLDYCNKHRILVAVFPPHATHRLQPLDVSLFGPLSQFYSQNLDSWIYSTGGIVSLSKREFWHLFWPSFESAFTCENIASGWMKTGLQPKDSEMVLSQIRPQTSKSNSSLSKEELRKFKTATRCGSADAILQHVPKLLERIEHAEAQVHILQQQLSAAENATRLEKKRRKRAQPLIEDLFEISSGQPMFFSPTKISKAKEKQAQRAQEEELEERRKQENKIQKQLQKEARQEEAAIKKAERQNLRVDKAASKAVKEHEKQVQKKAKKQPRRPRKSGRQESQVGIEEDEQDKNEQEVIVVEDSAQDEVVVVSLRRPQRQKRLPKYLCDENVQVESSR